MAPSLRTFRYACCFLALCVLPGALFAASAAELAAAFPTPLEQYPAVQGAGLWDQLKTRAELEPFNVVATAIFLMAVIHTFLAPKFRHWGHVIEEAHAMRLKEQAAETPPAEDEDGDGRPPEVSFAGQVLHFFGEVEAVFGIWALVLGGAIVSFKGWHTLVEYVGQKVNFTEPLFVVVIMALASTRPVLRAAEWLLRSVASLGRGSVGAWWLAILIVSPLMGSFITEPAAMTIAALLLARQFYVLKPSPKLAYATIGLLFVSISVGGTLTHFAAPPVLMVATPWKWDLAYMFTHFGWRATLGVVAAAVIYYLVFRRELAELNQRRVDAAKASHDPTAPKSSVPVPFWITGVQLGFMAWTVFVAHYPALFIGGFLFFLAFAQATAHHQSKLDLRPAMLVGFFLAGLVIHGGVQGWWIQPVLSSLGETALFFGATGLTTFNDNAAITYLATLVPNFSEAAKYAVVAGAVAGGGLTVIANAPNPAGQSILQRFFPNGVSPLGLLAGAFVPTLVMVVCFLVL